MLKYNVSTVLAYTCYNEVVCRKDSSGDAGTPRWSDVSSIQLPQQRSVFSVQGWFTGSDAEALSTATHSLNVGVVEDELAGQLRLHKVHLGSEKGQLSFFLDEHPHT